MKIENTCVHQYTCNDRKIQEKKTKNCESKSKGNEKKKKEEESLLVVLTIPYTNLFIFGFSCQTRML